MYFSALEISKYLEGELVGDPEARVSRPAKIEESGQGDISFIANSKYEDFAYTAGASVLIVNKDFNPKKGTKATLIKVKDAYSGFVSILEKFNSAGKLTGVEQPSFVDISVKYDDTNYIGAFAYIAKGVKIGKHVSIYPHAYIGENTEIGDGTVISSGVKIYAGTKIGKNCTIHANTVIGSDGFGFAPQADGTYRKVPQLGNVVIEDEVEIGANTVIDRATMGSTRIKKGTKLDNLIQVAHNVEIGENTVIAAQAGISGSTRLGKNCVVGGQAGFVGHITIANGTRVNAQSGVSKSIKEEGTALTGSPAFEYKKALRAQVVFKNLPALEQQLNDMKIKIDDLLKKGE